MRILHLLSQTELTGSEAYARELTLHQNRQGHQIYVISDQLHLEFPGHYLPLSIATRSFWQRIQNIKTLVRFLETNQIDVIHCHSRAACRHAYWATRFTETPMVTTLHGYQHVSWSKKLFDIYGDTIIAVCEKIQDQLCGDFKMDPSRIQVLRNPIEFPASPVADPSIRTTVSLIGRASGPKGRRLGEVFCHEVIGWLQAQPELRVDLILTGLSEVARSSFTAKIPESLRDRVSVQNHYIPLGPQFEKSQVVIASGRTALEAFAAGCEVISLGEARLQGRLTELSMAQQLADNLGDVGFEQILDTGAVSHELRNIWRNSMSTKERHQILQFLSREFSKTRILEQIDEIYRGARLWKKAPALPILMYHKVPSQELKTKHRIFVTLETFEKHLWFFQNQGFTTLTFNDLSDFWFERRPLNQFPKKPLMLTFDDGYKDNLSNAMPALQKMKMKASLFLLADHTITANEWDEDEGSGFAALMNSGERQQLSPQTFQIESHGLQHHDLRALSDEKVLLQMTESKSRLETEFQKPVLAFAYPYGWIDDRLPGLARLAGYDFAVNTDRGPLRWIDNRYSLFRINIFPEDSWFSLWKKTSKGYRKRYFRKRGI